MLTPKEQEAQQQIIDRLNEAVISDPILQEPGLILQMPDGQGQYIVGDDLKVKPWDNPKVGMMMSPPPDLRDYQIRSSLRNMAVASHIPIGTGVGKTMGGEFGRTEPLTEEELGALIESAKPKPSGDISDIYNKMKWPGSEDDLSGKFTPPKKKRKKKARNGTNRR